MDNSTLSFFFASTIFSVETEPDSLDVFIVMRNAKQTAIRRTQLRQKSM
jgi:hypothetical protein